MSLSTGRDKGFIDVFTETDVLLLEIHRYMPLHIIHIIICNVRIKVSISGFLLHLFIYKIDIYATLHVKSCPTNFPVSMINHCHCVLRTLSA